MKELNIEIEELLSWCCEAPVRLKEGDIEFYVCTACGKATDLKRD